jgi:hypothetical protein
MKLFALRRTNTVVRPLSVSRRKNWRGLLRVVGLWSLCGGLGSGLWAKSAIAGVGERIDDIGQQMLAWYGGRVSGGPRQLSINGLELRLESAVSDETIEEVFNHFAKECRKRAGVIADAKPQTTADGFSFAEFNDLKSGIMRRANDEKGTIVCIDTVRPLEAREFLERVNHYSKTQNFADIGHIRALSARRVSNRTHMLMMGSVGDLRLGLAFPKAGDVPGQEPRQVPRPQGTRRIFDSAEHDGGNAIHIYEGPAGEPGSVIGFYRKELAAKGWRFIENSRPNTLFAELGALRLLVIASKSKEGRVNTTLAELSR